MNNTSPCSGPGMLDCFRFINYPVFWLDQSCTMLPDLPSVKAHIHKLQLRALYAEIDKNAPVTSQIKRCRQHEGNRTSSQDEAGRARVTPFKSIGSRLEISAKVSSEKMREEVVTKLQELAKSLAEQSEKMMFSTLDEVTSEVGNTLDARGKPFHPNMMWDMLEKIQIDFDQHDNPIMPTMVLHPDMWKSIEPRVAEWEADPVLKRRKTEVIAKKWEEWRDRESNRKLVG